MPLGEVLIAIAVVSVIVIVARFVWVFPASYLPRWLSKQSVENMILSRHGATLSSFPSPEFEGVVSLAAALAIPLTLPDGQDFPHRDLILFVAFGVIFVTLVGIGLTLPMVVKALNLTQHGQAEAVHERETEIAARREILHAARSSLKDDHR